MADPVTVVILTRHPGDIHGLKTLLRIEASGDVSGPEALAEGITSRYIRNMGDAEVLRILMTAGFEIAGQCVSYNNYVGQMLVYEMGQVMTWTLFRKNSNNIRKSISMV